jgi:pimeloyl-ACP methyl ester carboxylesterase
MKSLFCYIVLFSCFISFGQDKLFTKQDIAINPLIDGTLLTPNEGSITLAIIIADSGPTDRNGNQNFMKNNSLKKLAKGLTANGIATYRYDKRTVKLIRRGKSSKNILFDDFVTDAIAVIDFFKTKNEYSKIYVIGHSQGSLVGMLAAKNRADGFVSLAGAGKNIGDVLIEQVDDTAPAFLDDTKRIVALLKEGKTTNDFPTALGSVFNMDTQPFMINWLKYNPQDELKKLNIPVLIVNGTKDLQVSVEEAKLLKLDSDNSKFQIIENMNHVLFIIKGDDLINSKSYNESFRNLSSELIDAVVEFIKN